MLCASEHGALCLRAPCSGSRSTVLWTNISRIITKGEEESGVCTIVTRHASMKQMTQESLEGFWRRKGDVYCRKWPYSCSLNNVQVLSYSILSSILTYPILVQADPLIKRALDKYFKDHNQRGGGKWRTDKTRFYQPDDSKVTRRLLKEKSKFTFVDV